MTSLLDLSEEDDDPIRVLDFESNRETIYYPTLKSTDKTAHHNVVSIDLTHSDSEGDIIIEPPSVESAQLKESEPVSNKIVDSVDHRSDNKNDFKATGSNMIADREESFHLPFSETQLILSPKSKFKIRPVDISPYIGHRNDGAKKTKTLERKTDELKIADSEKMDKKILTEIEIKKNHGLVGMKITHPTSSLSNVKDAQTNKNNMIESNQVISDKTDKQISQTKEKKLKNIDFSKNKKTYINNDKKDNVKILAQKPESNLNIPKTTKLKIDSHMNSENTKNSKKTYSSLNEKWDDTVRIFKETKHLLLKGQSVPKIRKTDKSSKEILNNEINLAVNCQNVQSDNVSQTSSKINNTNAKSVLGSSLNRQRANNFKPVKTLDKSKNFIGVVVESDTRRTPKPIKSDVTLDKTPMHFESADTLNIPRIAFKGTDKKPKTQSVQKTFDKTLKCYKPDETFNKFEYFTDADNNQKIQNTSDYIQSVQTLFKTPKHFESGKKKVQAKKKKVQAKTVKGAANKQKAHSLHKNESVGTTKDLELAKSLKKTENLIVAIKEPKVKTTKKCLKSVQTFNNTRKCSKSVGALDRTKTHCESVEKVDEINTFIDNTNKSKIQNTAESVNASDVTPMYSGLVEMVENINTSIDSAFNSKIQNTSTSVCALDITPKHSDSVVKLDNITTFIESEKALDKTKNVLKSVDTLNESKIFMKVTNNVKIETTPNHFEKIETLDNSKIIVDAEIKEINLITPKLEPVESSGCESVEILANSKLSSSVDVANKTKIQSIQQSMETSDASKTITGGARVPMNPRQQITGEQFDIIGSQNIINTDNGFHYSNRIMNNGHILPNNMYYSQPTIPQRQNQTDNLNLQHGPPKQTTSTVQKAAGLNTNKYMVNNPLNYKLNVSDAQINNNRANSSILNCQSGNIAASARPNYNLARNLKIITPIQNQHINHPVQGNFTPICVTNRPKLHHDASLTTLQGTVRHMMPKQQIRPQNFNDHLMYGPVNNLPRRMNLPAYQIPYQDVYASNQQYFQEVFGNNFYPPPMTRLQTPLPPSPQLPPPPPPPPQPPPPQPPLVQISSSQFLPVPPYPQIIHKGPPPTHRYLPPTAPQRIYKGLQPTQPTPPPQTSSEPLLPHPLAQRLNKNLLTSQHNISPSPTSQIISKGSTILGQNNTGVVRAINIAAVNAKPQCNIAAKPNNTNDSINDIVDTKSEMLEELMKELNNIPDDDDVSEDFQKPCLSTSHPCLSRLISDIMDSKSDDLSQRAKCETTPSPNSQPTVPVVVNNGYSPPILPIHTYEETFEYLAQVETNPISRGYLFKDIFTQPTNFIKKSDFCRGPARKDVTNFKKRKCSDDEKTVKKISTEKNNKNAKNLNKTTKLAKNKAKQNLSKNKQFSNENQQRAKKISIGEYKKRVLKNHDGTDLK